MATTTIDPKTTRRPTRAAWTLRLPDAAQDAAILGVLIFLYTFLLARGFLTRQFYFAGDNFSSLPMHSEVFASLRHSGSLAWWDPTLCDGVPIYAYGILFNPFINLATLPVIAAFRLIDPIVHLPIIAVLTFEGSVYVFALTLLALYLAARELTERRLAAVLSALTFSFCYIQAMNFKDGYLYPAVGALFFIYGLIRFSRRRRLIDLAWLAFFASLTASTVSSEFMQSAFFWVSAFAGCLLLLGPDLIASAARLIRQAWGRPRGRAIVIAGAVLAASGLLAAYVPYHLTFAHLLRYRGGAVDYGQAAAISTSQFPIESSQSWTVLLNWLPFRDVQDAGLLPNLIGGANDYRYLGMATVPLLLACLLLGAFDVHVWALGLAYFVCNAFLIYSTQNLAYQAALDHWAPLRSVRNLMTMFPRGGPSLFLILLSGIGLDGLLRREHAPNGRAFLEQALKILVLVGTALFAGLIFMTGPLRPLMHTAAHVGLYLAATALLCWALLRADTAVWQRCLCGVLFAFVFMDLIISLSSRFDLINEGAPYPHMVNEQVRVPASLFSARSRFPDDPELKPSIDEAHDLFAPEMVPPGGFHHNVYAASKEWLVLCSHPAGHRFLTTFDFATSIQTHYPHFEFFSNGYYAPLDRLAAIDTDRQLARRSPAFFLHEPGLVARVGSAPRPIEGRYRLAEFSFNEVRLETETKTPGFLYYLDNYDPYWSASVDGARTAVHRANFAFKAIELPAGSHR